jgi:hypothetical protein
MINCLILIVLVIVFYFFYRNYKYNRYLEELNTEHFTINNQDKIKLKNELPENPDVVFCDNYGNFNFIKNNKYTLVDNKNNILKNNININEEFKIPYSTNIKSGTKYKKYLILLTIENDILEYDLLEKKISRENAKSYFKNIKESIDKILFMNNYYYLFIKDEIIIYDKENHKIIDKNSINKIFKNAPKKFSAVFLNNNILYENIPYGSPCFFRNKDIFIYDLKKKDTFYSNGFIANTNYVVVNYTETKANFKVDKSGLYRIYCIGAGLESGGYGGLIFNDYNLIKNEKLEICVGGCGERLPLKDNLIVHDKLPFTSSSAGCGGSFVYRKNKLLMCAGGGGGWSSEIIKSPSICNSSFSHEKIYNKIIIPIKKMVLKTKNTDYHKKNNIKQKIVINDFKINSFNYNTVDYEVTEHPQNSNKTHLFETYFNNKDGESSITFSFDSVLSDYNFIIDCKIVSTNNDSNDCDLYIYDERNRELKITNFIHKFNNTKINSRKIISLFVKYPNTLNDFYVSSGNKSSTKYDDLFDNLGPNNLDFPLIKLNGGLGGGGFSYINKDKNIINCGGGGGYKGGVYTALNNEENEYIRKFLNIDYICGQGGLSYISNNKFDKNHFINDYNNDYGKVIIIKINDLQKLGKVEETSYLENKNNNLIDPSKFFYKNKELNKLNITVPSINNQLGFDVQNYKLSKINEKITKGINYFKVKLDTKKFDKIKVFIKSPSYVEIMLLYFSTKTLNRSIIKNNLIKKDNILSLNHGMIDPSLINIFSFLEKLIKQNVYNYRGLLDTNKNNKNSKNIINLFDNKDYVYEKSKEFLLDLNIKNIENADYLYILVNSFNKSSIKINLVQYNSTNENIKNNNLEYQIKNI